MIDIASIRSNREGVERALSKRMIEVDLGELLGLDAKWREVTSELDSLRNLRTKTSKQIGSMRAKEESTAHLEAEVSSLKADLERLESEHGDLREQIDCILLDLPNLPDEDVPAGGKENNQVLRVWGTPPSGGRDHVELSERLGLVDYKRGTKLGGAGFWMYRGIGAQLEWSLLNYFVSTHLADGYTFILPPHILLEECGTVAGQFPKFESDVFWLNENPNRRQFLLPTAETAILNLHRDEILSGEDLPLKYFAYTPCYRREAGSYRSEERGTIRGHQFNKVETFQYTTPETSDDAFVQLLAKAEALVQGLGLHYRVSKLAAGDCSASMASTQDIEVWIPSMAEFKEVSSVSNARSYQARRGRIRFKRKKKGKTEFVNTLNASGLATSRLVPAILEQNQTEDGSVVVPEPLRPLMGMEIIRA